MPYTTTKKWRADKLQVGMRINDFGEQSVRAVRVKTKYTYVDVAPSPDSDDVTTDVRFTNDELVDVLVVQHTSEEKLEIERRYALAWVERQLERLAVTPADYLTQKAAEWRERGPHAGPFVLDWSESDTFYHLQATYQMWRVIQRTYRRLVELHGADAVTPLTALVAELAMPRSNLQQNPTSRSTSVFFNLLADLTQYVWAKLREDIRFSVSEDVQRDELARLEKLRADRRAETQ